MAKEKAEKVEVKVSKSPDDEGSGKKKIIAVIIVVVVLIAIILAFLLTRGGEDGNNNRNHPPIAEFTYSPTEIYTNITVTFDATDSTDPDGDELEFSWNFGDPHADSSNPNTDSGVTATHIYTMPGDYNVTLVVEDGKSGIDEDIRNITVIEEEIPTADLLASKTLTTYETLTNIKWTVSIEGVSGNNDQLAFSNIRYNIYNGSDTNDVKLTGTVTNNPPSYVTSNSDGIYFDDVDDDSILSYGDTFSIAGDGGGSIPVEVGDHFQLIYKPPYFEEGVPMSDSEELEP